MGANPAEQKFALRRRMRLVREMVDDRLLRSVALWAEIAVSAAYESATNVMAFVAVHGEPDTDPLFARLERDGKIVVLPRVAGDRIVPCTIVDGLVVGSFGVPEPRGPEVPLGQLDLVLVPGLAFTEAGDRLGQGGGHYDRLLRDLDRRCPSIGVCFVEQIVDDLPAEPHDVRVDRVVRA